MRDNRMPQRRRAADLVCASALLMPVGLSLSEVDLSQKASAGGPLLVAARRLEAVGGGFATGQGGVCLVFGFWGGQHHLPAPWFQGLDRSLSRRHLTHPTEC